MEALVFETICEFLTELLGCDTARLRPSTVILEDLEAEPSDLEELMLMLEQEFGIAWSEDDLGALDTVGALTAFVENQL